jgi:hypothetical protein
MDEHDLRGKIGSNDIDTANVALMDMQARLINQAGDDVADVQGSRTSQLVDEDRRRKGPNGILARK